MTLRHVGCPGEKGPFASFLEAHKQELQTLPGGKYFRLCGANTVLLQFLNSATTATTEEKALFTGTGSCLMCCPLPCTGVRPLWAEPPRWETSTQCCSSQTHLVRSRAEHWEWKPTQEPFPKVHHFLSTYCVLGTTGRIRHSSCIWGTRGPWGEAALEMDMTGTFSSVSSSVTWT